MRSIRFRLLIAFAAVLLGTVMTKAQTADTAAPPPIEGQGGGHGFGMHQRMFGFFAHNLDLSDAQKVQVKSIMQKEHPVMKPLFQQSHQIDLQLREFAEGTFDEAKVRALAVQKAQLETELTVQRTRIHNELFQVLTTDQQNKMKELEARREARMQKHMQPGSAPAPEQQ